MDNSLGCTMRANALIASVLPGERCDEPATWAVWPEGQMGIFYSYACPACLMTALKQGVAITQVQHFGTSEVYAHPSLDDILGKDIADASRT